MAVAIDFVRAMQREGFKTFAEMVKCYWWDREDIAAEVNGTLEIYGTCLDIDNCFYTENEVVEFRDFMKSVKNKIRLLMRTEEY